MRLVYTLLGMFLAFNLTILFLEPIQKERDLGIVKVQSLQSCYFSAVKFAKQDPEESAKFCEQHSTTTTENFHDIANQMDEITDKKYSPVSFYYSKLMNLIK